MSPERITEIPVCIRVDKAHFIDIENMIVGGICGHYLGVNSHFVQCGYYLAKNSFCRRLVVQINKTCAKTRFFKENTWLKACNQVKQPGF